MQDPELFVGKLEFARRKYQRLCTPVGKIQAQDGFNVKGTSYSLSKCFTWRA